jgi:hypothetical protein
MRKYSGLIPVGAAYLASALVYNKLPADAAIDLSPILPVRGASNDTMPALAVALLIPTLALVVYFFLERLAAVTGAKPPLPEWLLNEKTGSAGVKRFEPTFHSVVFAVTALLALFHLVLLGSILGWPGAFFRSVTALLGFGLIAIGNVMPRVRPNWIVGIRTKRTLTDPDAWARTHRALGMLLILAGAVTVIATLLAPSWALIVAAVTLLASLALSGLQGMRRLDDRRAAPDISKP